MMKFRDRLHDWAFSLLLHFMDKTKPFQGASEDGAVTYIQWLGTDRVDRGIIVLQVSRKRARWRVVLSPAQAFDACGAGSTLILNQVGIGNKPEDWDVRDINYRLQGPGD